jgi:dipeptide/tripeptide permease
MTAGHFCMAFEASFLAALLLLILGAGVLRGNLTSQGDLYSEEDRRRETAFQIYYGALNSGAFVAPLITGVLAQSYGWHYGFGFAGFGMLVGLLVYLSAGEICRPMLCEAQTRCVGSSAPRSAASHSSWCRCCPSLLFLGRAITNLEYL